MPQPGLDPSQSITMLFTDVVDSSGIKRHASLGKTSEERDKTYLDTIQRPHFELIRECLRAYGGEEVSTMGDSFFATFREGEAALRCAIEIQQRMHRQPIATPGGPLRVRIGIHSGNPKFFNGSWHGTDVDTGARIEKVGTGGQILISSATQKLVQHLNGVRFHHLGKFVIRGATTLDLWEADWDGTGPRRTSLLPVGVQRRRNLVRACLGVVAAVVLVAAGYRVWETRGSGFGAATARRRVAVIGFENLSGKPDVAWLSTALAETLDAALGAGGKLRVEPSENIARAKIDLALPNSSSYSAQTLTHIRNYLGADAVILGGYLDLGVGSGQMRLDLRVQDTRKSDTLYAVSESGSEAGISDLVLKIGLELRQRLGAGPLSDSEVNAIKSALPSGSDATRLYAAGLQKLHSLDAQGARDLLQRAVANDPDFAPARTALSYTWTELGNAEKARDEAKAALDLSANVTPDQRVWIEASNYETGKEWDKAIDSYRKLIELHPDNLEYSLRLAAVQVRAGKGSDARITVRGLSKLRGATSDEARIDLAEAKADESVGEYGAERKAAERALAKARTLSAKLLQADALLAQGQAEVHLSDLAGAARDFKAAGKLYEAADDRSGVARSQASLAGLAARN